MRNSLTIKIIITGDFYPGGGRVHEPACSGNANVLLGPFLPMIRNSDLAITNLESPVIDGGKPIQKIGPAFKSATDALSVLKEAGFNLAALANNHIMDYGEEGLFSTVEACRKYGIKTTGAGKNLDKAKEPFLFEKEGVKVAILNFAENEFGTTQGESPGCHPVDPVQNFYSIQSARVKADHVIVIVHGGHEHYQLPSPRMKQAYRFYVDAGAAAVIAHHPHCVCGYEDYKGAPICYSLGNFLFDSAERNGCEITPWNEGLIAELTVDKTGVTVEYHPYVQNAEHIGLREMTAAEISAFDKTMKELNGIISDDLKLENEFERFCERSYRIYNSYIEPHSFRILHALRNRNILPSVLSNRKRKLLLNIIRCESHRDILIKTLTS